MALKNAVKNALSPYPALFIPIYRMVGGGNRRLLVRPDTEVVIEGFPRSANTFSVVAFQQAQSRVVRIAHHLHAEAQILYAARRGIPAIALIRDPEAAILSLKLIYPDLSEDRVLKRWLRFYGAVEVVRDQVVVSDFAQTTGDFGAVIARLNARFGTDFATFAHDEAQVATVHQSIEGIHSRREGAPKMMLARPTEQRREARQRMSLDANPTLLARAHALHARLLAANGAEPGQQRAPTAETPAPELARETQDARP